MSIKELRLYLSPQEIRSFHNGPDKIAYNSCILTDTSIHHLLLVFSRGSPVLTGIKRYNVRSNENLARVCKKQDGKLTSLSCRFTHKCQ